jgi:hypothetical protein
MISLPAVGAVAPAATVAEFKVKVAPGFIYE